MIKELHLSTDNRFTTRTLIIMSVYSLRDRTLANIERCVQHVSRYANFEFLLINKTSGELLTTNDLNVTVVRRPKSESLYHSFVECVPRRGHSHVLWVNDDDYFTLPTSTPQVGMIGVPFIRGFEEIHGTSRDYKDLATTLNDSPLPRRFEAIEYVPPLIFSQIPIVIFRQWINFVAAHRPTPPHLDVQLVLMLLASELEFVDAQYEYHYDSSNWARRRNTRKSSVRHYEAISWHTVPHSAFGFLARIDNFIAMESVVRQQQTQSAKSLRDEALQRVDMFANSRWQRLRKIPLVGWLVADLAAFRLEAPTRSSQRWLGRSLYEVSQGLRSPGSPSEFLNEIGHCSSQSTDLKFARFVAGLLQYVEQSNSEVANH